MTIPLVSDNDIRSKPTPNNHTCLRHRSLVLSVIAAVSAALFLAYKVHLNHDVIQDTTSPTSSSTIVTEIHPPVEPTNESQQSNDESSHPFNNLSSFFSKEAWEGCEVVITSQQLVKNITGYLAVAHNATIRSIVEKILGPIASQSIQTIRSKLHRYGHRDRSSSETSSDGSGNGYSHDKGSSSESKKDRRKGSNHPSHHCNNEEDHYEDVEELDYDSMDRLQQIMSGNIGKYNRMGHACSITGHRDNNDDKEEDASHSGSPSEKAYQLDLVPKVTKITPAYSAQHIFPVNTNNDESKFTAITDGRYSNSIVSPGTSPTSMIELKKVVGPYKGMILQVVPRHIDSSMKASSTTTMQALQKQQRQYDRRQCHTSPIRENSVQSRRLDTSQTLDLGYGEVNDQVAVDIYSKPCLSPDVVSRMMTVANVDGTDSSLPQLTEYELVDKLHGDLGMVDRHHLDFAYRPVMSTKSKSFQGGDDDQDDHNQSWSSSSASDHDWTYEHHQEFYEKMGDRAFAGGSQGQVWKARRRCNQIVTQVHNKHHNHAPTTATHQNADPICDDTQRLVMKRLKVDLDYPFFLEGGLREVYFGDILSRHNYIGEQSPPKQLFTKYIDHFFLKSPPTRRSGEEGNLFYESNVELWIVFEDAGPSLRSYIYTPVSTGDFQVFQHSDFWRRLRMGASSSSASKNDETSLIVVSQDHDTTSNGKVMQTSLEQSNANNNTIIFQHDELHRHHNTNHTKEPKKGSKDGQVFLKSFLQQVLTSAAKLHERGIVHRDIKPSNIMCKSVSQCVLGDFSSAWDEFSSDHLYSNGPSAREQTDEYAPPEVLIGREWIPFDEAKPESYDSWSIGVVVLELLLGSPNVFSVDQRTTTLLSNKMKKEGASADEIRRALYLASLSQFCIYVPTNASKSWPLREGEPLYNAPIVKTTCTIQDFHSALRARDPLGIGFDSSFDPLLQLIWGLLALDPSERLTASDALEHPYFTANEPVGDGDKNALEPQSLDPNVDMNVEEHMVKEFTCPHCGRKFDDIRSCLLHATSRRHSKFCTYDRSSLPPCLNAHSMLPAHPTSGYCDIQGRRRVIEDFHTVHLHDSHQFYGIFDGHNGNLASKYAASALYKRLVDRMDDVDDDIQNGQNWKSEVTDEMVHSFEEVHEGVLKTVHSYSGGVMSKSGTTATALFVTELAVIIANVGDSRAILSVGASFDTKQQANSYPLTVDHTASIEKKLVEDRGGYVESKGGVERVNGTLVLSRSIGDAHLARYLSRQPHVVALTKDEVRSICKKGTNSGNIDDKSDVHQMPCFIVLASDGLWDVISNQEAVDIVEQVIQKFDSKNNISWEDGGSFQAAAEILTQEAYLRGSSDNIGVCVVAIT